MQHARDDTKHSILKLEYVHPTSGLMWSFTVTSKHYVLVMSKDSGEEYVRAEDIKVGGFLRVILADGSVNSVGVVSVMKTRSAVRNLYTMNDRLVVDGVIASSFAEVAGVNTPRFTSLLWPLKMLHRVRMTEKVRALDSVGHHFLMTASTFLSSA